MRGVTCDECGQSVTSTRLGFVSVVKGRFPGEGPQGQDLVYADNELALTHDPCGHHGALRFDFTEQA